MLSENCSCFWTLSFLCSVFFRIKNTHVFYVLLILLKKKTVLINSNQTGFEHLDFQKMCWSLTISCMVLKISGQGLDWSNHTGLEVQENNSCSFFSSNKCKQVWFLSSICISWWPPGWTVCYSAFTHSSLHITHGEGCKLLPSRWHENIIIPWWVSSLCWSCEEDSLRPETMIKEDLYVPCKAPPSKQKTLNHVVNLVLP